jgi:hypothetical protein
MTDRTRREIQFLARSPARDHSAPWIHRAFFRWMKVVEHVAGSVDECPYERMTDRWRVHGVTILARLLAQRASSISSVFR